MEQKKFSKIENLAKALRDIGIFVEIDWNAERYCSDKKTHIGIELSTNKDDGEDYLSFIFAPNGQYKTTFLECPIKIQKR